MNSFSSEDVIQVVDGGFDSSFSTITHIISGTGVGQYLDHQCLSTMKGRKYELKAFFKLMIDNNPVSCDPSNENGDCPRFFTLSKYYDEDKKVVKHELEDLGTALVTPYDSNDWSMLRKEFTITDDLENYLSVFLYVNGGSDGVNIWLDKLSMSLL